MGYELWLFLLVGTAALALLLLLFGAMIPTGSRRGLSAWVMITGMAISLFALGALFFLAYFDYNPGDDAALALAFSIPGGLLFFSGGFLLSRLEARRQSAQLEMLAQHLPPTVQLPASGVRR